jgi:glycosyltransferase involved in cell wall biosynthesis
MGGNRVWITWENQRRNRELSRALGATLFEFEFTGNRLLRYGVSLFKTILTFVKERPTLIFAQNPSLLLALFAVTYGRATGIPVVIDAHNAGLFPLGGQRGWANRVAVHVLRKATLTIVTNDNLKRHVEEAGGSAFVLTDPIPSFFLKREGKNLKGEFNVLFICSFGQDEPYQEVFKAARELDKSIAVFVTGNPRGLEKHLLQKLPENVVLTGYLPEDQYIQLLHLVDVVIDLTTREDCLVCGGYEAMAAEKPLVVSDKKVLKEYFSKGALFTDNSAANLAAQIQAALRERAQLRKEMIELKRERTAEWFERRAKCEELLSQIETPSRKEAGKPA